MSSDGTDYVLTAKFGSELVTLETAAEGALDKENQSAESILSVRRSSLFHFALAVASETHDSSVVTKAGVFDADGKSVFHVTARPGETQTANTVLLTPGEYRIQIEAESIDGKEIPELSYRLMYRSISFPIGPGYTDPTVFPDYYIIEPAPPEPPFGPLDNGNYLTDPLQSPIDYGNYFTDPLYDGLFV